MHDGQGAAPPSMASRIDAMMADYDDDPSDGAVVPVDDMVSIGVGPISVVSAEIAVAPERAAGSTPELAVADDEELSMDDVSLEGETPLPTPPPASLRAAQAAIPPQPAIPPPPPAIPPPPPGRPPLAPGRPPLPPVPSLRPPPPKPPAIVPPRPPPVVIIPPVATPEAVMPANGDDGDSDVVIGDLSVGELSDVGIPLDVADAEAVSEVSGVIALPDAPEPAVAAVEPVLPASEVPLEQRLESPTAIERALGDLGEAAWEERAGELTRRLDAATDRAQIADLAYELGELCERRLVDEARAVKAFGRALASDPSLRANLWAIRRVFYRRSLWPNLIKLIDAESRFAIDDDERADLSIEKATILLDKLGNADDARAALEDAVLLAPTSVPALIALERVADDPARQVEVWAQLAAATERPERRLAYLLDQVRFWTERGDDLDRARELLGQAAALCESAGGLELERVTRERLRVADLAGDREEALAALDAMAGHLIGKAAAGVPDAGATAGGAGAAPGRAAALRLQVVALRRRQAQLARGLGAGDRAWNYLQAAIALAPGEPLLLADLADLAEELGRYDELADLVQSWQAIEGDPSRALALSIRRADALLRAGQREPALAVLASVEATAPGFAPVVALRERDALVVGDRAALAEAWQRAGDAARLGDALGPGGAADPAAAVAAYVAAAQAWLHDVGGERGDAAAATALGLARELAPSDPVVLEASVELHERAGRIDDAAALLTAVETPEAAARLTRLYRSAGRVADALAVDRARGAREPNDLTIAWRIDGALDELGQDGERLPHLLTLGDRERDPARRGFARAAAARLAEAAGDNELAIELYRRMLSDWPDDRFAHAALLAALRRVGRWDELAVARRAQADGLADGPEVARALREAAWLYEDRLARPRDALAVYRQLLDRAPDDVHARAGAVRTAIAAGDLGSAVRTLELAVDDGGPAALAWALAREQAGELDDAGEAYLRAEAASGPDAASGAQAAVAALTLAARRGDTLGRVAATRALAARAGDVRLVGALQEDLGWLYALVLEDFDLAADAFAAARDGASPSAGALLGAALVAARRQDRAALALAFEQLAAQVAMPEAAAAMYLRAAAIATAAGEHDAAMARVAAARHVAPDDVGALLVAAEQQATATPPAPGEDAASAVDRLLARADVLAMRSTLADDPAARDGWELDRAEALEAAGRLREAGAAVTAVLRASPGDVRALEALLRLAARGGDRATEARAALALAAVTAGPDGKRELYTRAAAIFDSVGAGADLAGAVAVYRTIVADQPGATCFERLIELVRSKGDVRTLFELLGDRLTWIAAGNAPPSAAVPLLSERAQLRRTLGDVRGAAIDLDQLLAVAPEHKDALRRRADIAGELGEAAAAVALWRRYLAVETDTSARGDAELVLARTLAEDLGDVNAAIEQVERVIAQRPGDVMLRERLVGLATQGQVWPRVVRELREIARLRGTTAERARDELRLARVARDHLGDPAEAVAAFERGRQLDPLHLDLLREHAELAGRQRAGGREQVLIQGIEAFRRGIDTAPTSVALYDRLATVLGWAGDKDAQWLALVALEALGAPGGEQRALIAAGRERPAPPPTRQLLEPIARAALRATGSTGVAADLWRAMAPSVTAALAVDPAKLGFGRGDRIAMKALGKKYEPLAAALASLGVDDVELYVSEGRAGQARVLSGETPIVCCGADVAAGATAAARFLLGRAAWQAAEASAALVELKDAEVAWFVLAALKVAGVQAPAALTARVAGDDAAIAERTRLIDKHITRRDKKAVAALASRLGELGDLVAWRQGMLASSHRAGLWLGGDLGIALAALDVGRGGRHLDPTTVDLVRWSVSAAHAALREGQRGRSAAAPGGSR